jgi:UDP-glucuronate decarboxylase
MKVYENSLYQEDVNVVADLDLPWEKLQDSSIMISGATGMIGSFLCDVIMMKNQAGLNCDVYALGRTEEKAHDRFEYCWEYSSFHYVKYDVNKTLETDQIQNIDFVLHLASNTHPLAYSNDPIGTITANVIGLKNMLDFCVNHNATRFAFASSNEIYGENRGDVEKFSEEYCGYINCNTMRAGYPESKRCGEALCQAYINQKGLDIVIPRLTRSYGPTLLKSDTKALSQFLHKAVAGEDIVLKSAGTQYYSYTYVADAVSGLLTVLLKGKKGEAYNISDEASDIQLRDLATAIADIVGRKVIFEIPDAMEASGYSRATKARLDSKKINKELGWKAKYSIKEGLERTIVALGECR